MHRTHPTHARTRARWLTAFEQLGTVSAASAAVNVARTTPYAWRTQDPDFAIRWDEISADWADRLEAEAYRRAVDGITQPIVVDGQVVGTRRVYSDRLLMFLLESRRPEIYREPRHRVGKNLPARQPAP